jgi:hypothetical protein
MLGNFFKDNVNVTVGIYLTNFSLLTEVFDNGSSGVLVGYQSLTDRFQVVIIATASFSTFHQSNRHTYNSIKQ